MNTARKLTPRQAKTLALADFARRQHAIERDAPQPPDPGRRHAELEELTASFRRELAKKHFRTASERRREYNRIVNDYLPYLADFGDETRAGLTDLLRKEVSGRKWHADRGKGQLRRFPNVNNCGTAVMKRHCGTCGHEYREVPQHCGVRRVCQVCDVSGAAKRRAKFGRGRGRALLSGMRYGLTRHNRKGGRFSEKMLTLTIPQPLTLEELPDGVVKEIARDMVDARCKALWLAYPLLMRRVRAYFKKREPAHYARIQWHRAFEWTPSRDGSGHPHFHIYFFAPFIDAKLIRAWWGEALFDVGWPVRFDAEDLPDVRVDLKMLRGWNQNALTELLKGGRRSALTLSQIDDGPGNDAYAYAEGWTLADVQEFCSYEVQAKLYCALEAKRLTQASAGFFTEEQPHFCACCGSDNQRIHIVPLGADVPPPSYVHAAHTERPPP